MNESNMNSNIFEIALKLNKLKTEIIQFLANSLNIEYKREKPELINSILFELKKLDNKEIANYKNIIEEYIKEIPQDTPDNLESNNKIKLKEKSMNKKVKKRNYNESINEKQKTEIKKKKQKYLKNGRNLNMKC